MVACIDKKGEPTVDLPQQCGTEPWPYIPFEKHAEIGPKTAKKSVATVTNCSNCDQKRLRYGGDLTG